MPSQPRVTSPSLMICSSTLLASDTGIAKPMPCEPPLCENIALLMPTRLPPLSTSAPPELPGLTAASVWMKSSNRLMPRWLRPSALMIPCVTRAAEAERAADREHGVADLHVVQLAERDRRQILAVDLQHGQI